MSARSRSQEKGRSLMACFLYNPAFDALRFTVKPLEAPHEEYLRYTIQPAGSNAAGVTLAWEKRAVTFRLDVSP